MPTIPSGYHVASFTFNVTGSTRNVMCTFAGRNQADFSATPILTAWRASMVTTTAGQPFSAAQLPTTYQLVSTKVLANIGGTLYSDESFTVVTGTGTTTPLPMNCAVLVNKVTGIAGRKYRGRIWGPAIVSEANVDQAGIIAAGTLTTIQGFYTAGYNAIDGLGYQPVILHGDGTTPTDVNSFTVSQRVGTIGRRMRG